MKIHKELFEIEDALESIKDKSKFISKKIKDRSLKNLGEFFKKTEDKEAYDDVTDDIQTLDNDLKFEISNIENSIMNIRKISKNELCQT